MQRPSRGRSVQLPSRRNGRSGCRRQASRLHRQAKIDRDAAAPGFVDLQRAPGGDAAAVGAEVKAQRVAASISPGLAFDRDALALVVIGPQHAVATAGRASPGGQRRTDMFLAAWQLSFCDEPSVGGRCRANALQPRARRRARHEAALATKALLAVGAEDTLDAGSAGDRARSDRRIEYCPTDAAALRILRNNRLRDEGMQDTAKRSRRRARSNRLPGGAPLRARTDAPQRTSDQPHNPANLSTRRH